MLKAMKQMMCSPSRLVLLALVATGLTACAEDPHAHYYHPHSHMGQGTPDWYRPPATPAGSVTYKKSLTNNQKRPGTDSGALQYDR